MNPNLGLWWTITLHGKQRTLGFMWWTLTPIFPKNPKISLIQTLSHGRFVYRHSPNPNPTLNYQNQTITPILNIQNLKPQQINANNSSKQSMKLWRPTYGIEAYSGDEVNSEFFPFLCLIWLLPLPPLTSSFLFIFYARCCWIGKKVNSKELGFQCETLISIWIRALRDRSDLQQQVFF